MITIAYLNSLLDIIQPVFFMIFIVWKWADIKDVFCEGNTGRMSSKRVIAIMGMYTLCKLAILVTHSSDKIDPLVLLTFSIIILLSAAIATAPQILEGLAKMKTIIPGVAPSENQKFTKKTEEVVIENKPPEKPIE